MTLRARVALIASGCSLLLAAAILLGSHVRILSLEKRHSQALLTGYTQAWNGILTVEIERLRAFTKQIEQDPRLPKMIASNDKQVIGHVMRLPAARLQSDTVPAHIEVFNLDSKRLFTSGLSESFAMKSDRVQILLEQNSSQIDFVGESAELALRFATPLFTRQGPVGGIAITLPLAPLILRLAASTQAEVFLLGANGSVYDGDQDRLRGLVDTLPPLGLYEQAKEGQYFELAHLPVNGTLQLREINKLSPGRLVVLRDITASRTRRHIFSSISYGAIVVSLLLFLGMFYWYMRRSFRPLGEVIHVLKALSRGTTDVATPIHKRRDEIGRLASTVEIFRSAQQARQKLDIVHQELEVAQRIQNAILPDNFPKRSDFEIYAEIHSAREVGGDFYDFFDLPDGRIGLAIGDVSGKGAGAALFMAVARTVIRTAAPILLDPALCMKHANDFLSRDNDAAMFVTVFYAAFDSKTGTLVYVNAGHNPPYRLLSDGCKATSLLSASAPALGLMEEMEFDNETLTLKPGERLLMYTDGVPEAINEQDKEFSEDRLSEALCIYGARSHDVQTVIKGLINDVTAFAGQAPQFDDITCLGLAYHGSGNEAQGREKH